MLKTKSESPTFEISGQLTNVDLVGLNGFLKAWVPQLDNSINIEKLREERIR